jgi:hypothetical protein
MTNFKTLLFILVFVGTISLAIFVAVIYESTSSCDTVDSVNMSVEVVGHSLTNLGFDVDINSVDFGTLSPNVGSKKVIYLNYTQFATAIITLESNFTPWVMVEPAEFETSPNQTQEVVFNLLVPLDAPAGNYTGKIEICYRDV